jgi:CBS-domain-containing membrane protein
MPYRPLELSRLDTRVTYHRPTQVYDKHISLNSPGYSVMTDLAKVTTITIGPMAGIDEANERMIAHGVRMLLVTDESELTLGLITTTDILGEKPLTYLREVGGNHGEILVQDIMTPYDQLEVMQLTDVLNATVGDVIATLKMVGRQHALVVDGQGQAVAPRLRGIFSTTQIGRLVGEPVDVAGKAGNFAELELALTHGH